MIDGARQLVMRLVIRLLRRISAAVMFVLRHQRFTVIYAAVFVIVTVLWLASLWAAPVPAHSSIPSSASAPPPATVELQPESKSGGIMGTNTPDTQNTIHSQTSVNATDSGTDITVNGATQSVPAGQSFQRSYDSSDGTTSSHTDVSVENNSNSSGSSVNLNVSSETSSETSSESHSGSSTFNPNP